MEGPHLPEGSGGEEPPEELSQFELNLLAAEVYEARMWLFDHVVMMGGHTVRKRRKIGDYTTKNCEEAWGQRGEGR